MNKTIIILSGTPDAKNTFDRLLKENSWVWNVNPKNALRTIAEQLGWNREDGWGDEYQDFISDILSIANKHVQYETKYIQKQIQDFLSDNAVAKQVDGTKEFTNFTLVWHGVSKAQLDSMKENGAIHILLADTPPEDFKYTQYDYVVYCDEPVLMDSQLREVINKLLRGG